MSNAREGTRWYRKLKEREPSVPDLKKTLKKIPTPFDYRTGEVQKTEELDLTEWIVHISTLKKGETIDVLLNPSDWHEEQLEEAKEIKTFEIVHHPERGCEYMVHISCEFETQTARTRSVCGVDLGIKRDLSAVLIDDDGIKQFSVLQTGKSERLKELDDRIAHLRLTGKSPFSCGTEEFVPNSSNREEKYKALKRLRNKRERVAEDYDRKLAKEFAGSVPDGTAVFFGIFEESNSSYRWNSKEFQ